MTDDAVLHALVDLVQALDQQNIILVNCPAYENAYKVLRDNVRIKQPEPAPTFHEVGFLSRNRDGVIRWHQTSNMLPFPLHATVNVYMKGVPGSKPQKERE